MEVEPKGTAVCPSCNHLFNSVELVAVHLASSKGCRDDLVRQNHIQLLSEFDSIKRLILTDSLYLTIEKRCGLAPDIVIMHAVSVLGELVDVSVWEALKEGRRVLRMRKARK